MIKLTEKQKNKIITWIVSIVIGALIGRFYTEMTSSARGAAEIAHYPGVRAGLLIAGLSAGLEIFLIAGPLGRWLFKRPFYQTLFFRLLAHWVLITGGLLFGYQMTGWLTGNSESGYGTRWFLSDTLIAFSVLAFALFFIQMRTLIGGRMLINLLTGRYHRPVEEERLFLLIDVVGSTALAKRLGDKAFYSFLSDFIADIDPFIFESKGEIYSYVGDAVIVTWPLQQNQSNSRVVKALVLCQARLKKRSAWYLKRYQTTPKFRAVLHGGKVFTGEYGGYRRQITYLGEVLNTTARLETLCKNLNVDVLLSDAATKMVTLPDGITLSEKGEHLVKGLEEPLKVFSLDLDQVA